MIGNVVAALIGLAVGGVICFFLGIRYRKTVSEKEISSAEEEGKRIINEAIKSAESKKREALVEAKEKILAEKTNYEREAKERRSELQEQERRLQQKEETLERKLENLPNNLSGGQQQRVAIARALASTPAIILADEPTGNLDSKTSQDVLGLLKVTSQKYGQTIVMITHNEEIAQLADRIIRIEDGKIVERR